MKKEKLAESIGLINDNFIDEYDNYVSPKKKIKWTRFISAAACLFLILTVSTVDFNDILPIREANEYKSNNSSLVCKANMNVLIASNIKEISDRSNLIVKTKLVKRIGVFNTSKILQDKGYNDVGTQDVRTFYEMEILDVYKGNIKIGDRVEIAIDGGFYDGVLYVDNFSEELTAEFNYILFLAKSHYADMPYMISYSYQGYLPFKNNNLSLNKKISPSKLFRNGESEKEVIGKIKKSLR